MRGVVIFDYIYVLRCGFRFERMHALESIICALFGLYGPDALADDPYGRQFTEMSFCPLFEELLTANTELTVV